MKPLSVLTSFFIIIPAGALVLKGVDLLRYERAEALMLSVGERVYDKNIDKAAIGIELTEMLGEAQKWAATPGVAGRARLSAGLLEEARGQVSSPAPATLVDSEDTHKMQPDSASPAQDPHLARLESAMSDLLSMRPTDGRHWLELAKLRLQRGAAMSQIMSALEMSTVTEGREQETMASRAPLLLALWENLSESEKRVAVNQFVELDGDLGPRALSQFKAILSTKSPETRAALKAAIVARGADARPWLKTVGL